ncbi:MAG: carboxypeptidase regulatory-like domain-containing protein [Ignisphaera sp.]|nr:carboxypeptidase regulatory-like domain-containing protein [Ignisphaera sp.]
MMGTRRTSIHTLAIVLLTLVVVVAVHTQAQALTVRTDRPSYLPGDTVVASGTAPANSWVGVSIMNPAGKEIDFKLVQAGADGTYRAEFKLPTQLPYGDWTAGTYTVKAWLGTVTATTTFTLAPGARIYGRVVDTKGSPVADAEIAIVETGVSTRSRVDGVFELHTLPGNATIRVAKTGYIAVEKSVRLALGDNDIGTIAIQALDEVVATLSSKVATLETRVAQLEKTLSDIQKTLQDISTAIGRLATKDDVVGARNDILAALRPISTDLAAVKGDVAAIKSDVAAAKSDLATVKSDVAAVKGAMATKSDVEAVRTAVADLNTALKSVSDAVTAARGDITKVRTDVLDAVASAVNAARDASAKADDAKRSADAAKSSADAAVSGINAVRGDVANIKATVADTSGAVSGVYTLVVVALVFAVIGAAASIYMLLRLSKALGK